MACLERRAHHRDRLAGQLVHAEVVFLRDGEQYLAARDSDQLGRQRRPRLATVRERPMTIEYNPFDPAAVDDHLPTLTKLRHDVRDDGRGTHEYRNVMGRVDIITGTLGKTPPQAFYVFMIAGAIAAIGVSGGAAYHATVYPLILRGIKVLGIDMPSTPLPMRQQLPSLRTFRRSSPIRSARSRCRRGGCQAPRSVRAHRVDVRPADDQAAAFRILDRLVP